MAMRAVARLSTVLTSIFGMLPLTRSSRPDADL
jgi:hypothetical protein